MASYLPSQGPALRTERRGGGNDNDDTPEREVPTCTATFEPSREAAALHSQSDALSAHYDQRANSPELTDDRSVLSAARNPRSEAAGEIEKWRRRRAEELKESEAEKRKDLENLRAYQPWGRPGGGAPNVNHDGGVNTKLHMANTLYLEVDKESENSSTGAMSLHLSTSGGGGSVHRTDSGRLLTKRHGDRETRFQPSFKKHVQNELRYAAGQEKDTVLSPDQAAESDQATSDSHTSPRDTMAFFPFGRPGCGAPLRHEDGQLKTSVAGAQQAMEEMEAKMMRRQQALRYREHLAAQLEEKRQEGEARKEWRGRDESYSPWGKGYGSLTLDSAGFTKCGRRRLRPPVVDASTRNEVDCVADHMGRPGGGAPLSYSNGEMCAKLRSRTHDGGIVKDRLPSSEDSYIPWQQTSPQRAGARRVQPLEFIREEDHPTAEQRQQYLATLKEAAEKDLSNRRVSQRLEKESGPESTADWMGKLQVGRPRRHPLTGEVVSPRSKADDIFAQSKLGDVIAVKPARYAPSEQHDLHDDLTKQASMRQQQRLEERRSEIDQARQHVETFNTMWGRPGAGAPLRDKNGKIRAGRNYAQLGEDSHKTEGVR